jgi:membrane-associated phospholipid phosphatase
MKTIIICLVLNLSFLTVCMGQTNRFDSTFQKSKLKKYILPIVLAGAGIALNNPGFKEKQLEFRNDNFANFRNKTDDLMMFTPGVAVVGLDLLGVKSKHNLGDKVGLLVVGSAFALTTVLVLKGAAKELRPDGSTYDSFPSGHTANAFLGATILAKEYGSKSVWYTIGGYSVATATGVFRILNNRHWAGDVLTGAGIGIISGELAYIVYPWIKKNIVGKHNHVSIVPIYDGNTMGGTLVVGF